MPFNFDAPVDRRNSDSIRWDRYASDDVIPLWVADMDFQSPPCVIDALAERVQDGVLATPMRPTPCAVQLRVTWQRTTTGKSIPTGL